MLAYRQAANIFKHELRSAEPVAWSASEHNIDRTVLNAGTAADITCVDIGGATAQGSAFREVELVGRAISKSRPHHASSARKQVDSDRYFSVPSHRTKSLAFVLPPSGEGQNISILPRTSLFSKPPPSLYSHRRVSKFVASDFDSPNAPAPNWVTFSFSLNPQSLQHLPAPAVISLPSSWHSPIERYFLNER